MTELPNRLEVRLNPEDEDERTIAAWLASLGRRGKSEEVRKALLVYLTSIPVSFNPEDPIDRKLIEAIGHMEDNPQRAAQWLKQRAYERITGQDAITGNPLPENVRVIEKPMIIEKEVIKVIYADGSAPASAPAPVHDEADDTTTRKAHDELSDLSW